MSGFNILTKCPWPADIFTATRADLPALLPDEHLRTRVAGLFMREAWQMCHEDFEKILNDSGLCLASCKYCGTAIIVGDMRYPWCQSCYRTDVLAEHRSADTEDGH